MAVRAKIKIKPKQTKKTKRRSAAEISAHSEGLQRDWQCTSGQKGTQNNGERCGRDHNEGPSDTAAVQIGYSHLEGGGEGRGGVTGVSRSFVPSFKGPPEFQSPPCSVSRMMRSQKNLKDAVTRSSIIRQPITSWEFHIYVSLIFRFFFRGPTIWNEV